MPPTISIRPVRTADEIAAVAALFRAYEEALEIDLEYQDFTSEVASLPGKYAPPSGALLLARDEMGRPVGCIGLRPMEQAGRCEMKRLFVSPEGRGCGLGERLVDALVREARRIGYKEMCLDTLPSMSAAQVLYRAKGFEPIPAYYLTPIEGTAFLGLNLQTGERVRAV